VVRSRQTDCHATDAANYHWVQIIRHSPTRRGRRLNPSRRHPHVAIVLSSMGLRRRGLRFGLQPMAHAPAICPSPQRLDRLSL